MGTPLLVALIGTLSSIVIVVLTKYKERTAAIAQANRDRKIPVYEDILKKALPIAESVRSNSPEKPDTSELTQMVAMWASNEVLVLYLRFRIACENPTDGEKWTVLFSDMMLAIREDLGYMRPCDLNDTVKNGIGAWVLQDSASSQRPESTTNPI